MNNLNYSFNQLADIFLEAREAAQSAANEYLSDKLGGQDSYPCGFAWVNIPRIKGSTKLGKMLNSVPGVKKNTYERVFQMWNPSGLYVQNVDVLLSGARAAAEVLKKYGFEAYAGSRWD